MWKVVIIDDDRHILRRMKRAIDWHTLGAICVGEGCDGNEGLSLITAEQPDIVITDIYMPVMNGLDMLAQLQKHHFSGKTIILSGYSDFEYARQALRLNVHDYLSKPVRLQTIMEVLTKVINQLQQEQEERHQQAELRDKLMQYEPFVQQQSLIALLTGTRDPAAGSSRPLLPLYNERTPYAVLGIEIIRNRRLSGISVRDWKLFRFAIGNIIKELLAEEWASAHYVELFSHHAAILLPIDQLEESPQHLPVQLLPLNERLQRLGRRILTCAEDYLRVQLHIGIGRIHHGLQQIAQSTEEAFHALSQRSEALRDAPALFTYSPADATVKPTTSHPAEEDASRLRPIRFYQQLGEAIRQSREQQALAIVNTFLDTLATNGAEDLLYLQRLGIEIATIIAYSSDTAAHTSQFRSLSILHRQVQEIATIKQLRTWVHEKITAIFTDRGWQDNIKHRQAVEFMISYVHSHCQENISLSDLAGKVFISRNYLSEIFRQSIGESFSSYLTRVRMEKARTLLLEGKYLIYEVAEMVGYRNVPYFSTLFKRYNGVNPSDFGKPDPNQDLLYKVNNTGLCQPDGFSCPINTANPAK